MASRRFGVYFGSLLLAAAGWSCHATASLPQHWWERELAWWFQTRAGMETRGFVPEVDFLVFFGIRFEAKSDLDLLIISVFPPSWPPTQTLFGKILIHVRTLSIVLWDEITQLNTDSFLFKVQFILVVPKIRLWFFDWSTALRIS